MTSTATTSTATTSLPQQPAMVESLRALAATRVDVGQDEHEATWVVLADPEGNELCVLSPRAV